MGNPYAFGTRSIETLRLQKALNGVQIDVGIPDGIFGRLTKVGVEVLQHRHGLAVTGYPDDRTLIALGLKDPPATDPNWLVRVGLNFALNRLLKGTLPMFSGYKTYATAIVLAIVAAYSLMFGDLPLLGHVDPGSAIMAILSSLGLGFARAGAKNDAAGK